MMSLNRIGQTALLIGFVLLPSVASAQRAGTGSIAGAVEDATGGVLPGVTVEATSPALIEQVRSAVTDSQGRYAIIELRPGTYDVTFTLPAFGRVRREGIQLTGGFTAAVNATLEVGAVEETVTVTGVTPIVDVHNVREQTVLSRDVIEAVPTNNAVMGFASLVPGAVLSGITRSADVGGAASDVGVTIAVHGARGQDMKPHVDGMQVGTSMGNGGGTSRFYTFNPAAAEEIVVETAGVSAEAETGGVQLNMVPREGGNTFSGVFDADYTNRDFQSDNFSDALAARGVSAASVTEKIYAARVGLGGPIVQDKLWFYGSAGKWYSSQEVPGNWYNARPGTLFYEPDLSRPGILYYPNNEKGVRLTWNAAENHKISFHVSDESGICTCGLNMQTGTHRPEAALLNFFDPTIMTQGSWTYPVTSRLLIQAGGTWMHQAMEGRPSTESAAVDRAVRELSDGFRYGSRFGNLGLTDYASPGKNQDSSNFNTRFSVSYVTGSHNFKVGGTTINWARQTVNNEPNFPEFYNFRNAVPVSLIQIASPHASDARVKLNFGLYAQDQWTMDRLTLNLGVRFSHLNTYTPEQTRPAGKYAPEHHFDEVTDVVNWKDIEPRLGANFDLVGNGRTSLKVTFGRYVQAESLGITARSAGVGRLVTQATRTWNDANGDYVPDCDLHDFSANGECGTLSDPNLGQFSTRPFRQWSPDVTQGWGTRPHNFQASVSVEQELNSIVSLTAGWFRTSYGNFTVNDNLVLAPGDYDEYCITVPSDSRIPGGGGNELCGNYDLNPEAFGQAADILTRPASDFGDQSSVYNGFDVTVDARFGAGGLLRGGLSTGRTTTNDCFAVDSPDQLQFCEQTRPFAGTTQIKLHGFYPLPWDMQVSGVFQTSPGPAVAASHVVTNAQVADSLGRNLGRCRGAAVCSATATVGMLFEPFQEFEERHYQFDFRLTKSIQAGPARLQGVLDIYNVFNSASIITMTSRYNASNSWLRPTAVLPGRLLKFGFRMNF